MPERRIERIVVSPPQAAPNARICFTLHLPLPCVQGRIAALHSSLTAIALPDAVVNAAFFTACHALLPFPHLSGLP
jgi:hypothetical protein